MKIKILGIFVVTLLISAITPGTVLGYEVSVEKGKVQNGLDLVIDQSDSSKFTYLVRDDLIEEIAFYQLDWYVNGEIYTKYSSWGRMDIDVNPDPDAIFYMNVLAMWLHEPAWIMQNYPILPELHGVPNEQAIHFNIEDLGIPEGDALPFMEVLITATLIPLQEPPVGEFYDVIVNTLIRDAWGHGDWPPAHIALPPRYRARNAVVNIIQHENVPSVQEAVNNCITGSYSRSIKWLDNEYDLRNLSAGTTAQEVYENLTSMGVGHGTGQGLTEEEMLTNKSDYLYKLDNRSVTKFVDYGYLGNVQNATEVTTTNLSKWLADELKTEDIEMCYDSHCICITGMYKQGNKTFLRYRDDEEQGNDSAGDNRTKVGELVNDSGEWKFLGSKVDYVVSESINNPPGAPEIDGPPSGDAGEEYEFTFHATDPDGDSVYYYIDWGDGTNTGWIGPYPHCTVVTLKHTYANQGTYIIKAKAKDEYEAESDWSEFEVAMPRNKAITSPFLNFLQNHPNLFQILQQLILRLGLQ